MKTKQLNVRLPASLVDDLKSEAASSGMTLNALVERRLSGDLATAKPVQSDLAADLATRLAAVEKRLAALEAASTVSRPPRPPKAPQPKSDPQAGALVPLSPTTVASRVPAPPKLTAHPDAITGPKLAERYGVRRNSFNEKVRRLGGAQVGRVVELNGDRWRCVGQVASSSGGSPQWVWEAV